jgi:hypothetical protein
MLRRQQTPTQLAAQLLNCGTMDIDFIIQAEAAFDVDLYLRERPDWGGTWDANSVIDRIFNLALDEANFDWDRWGDKVEIYCNCIDSHLSVDGEEMYSKEDIEAAIKRLRILDGDLAQCSECKFGFWKNGEIYTYLSDEGITVSDEELETAEKFICEECEWDANHSSD